MLKQLNILIAVILLACIGCTRQEGRDTTRADGLEVEVFPQLGHSSAVRSVAISPDEKYALSASWDSSIKLWDISTGREIRTFNGHNGGINSVIFTQDGKHILSGSEDKTLRLWDIATGQAIGTPFEGHAGVVNSVAITPDGKYALSGSDDKTLMLWDITTGQMKSTFRGHENGVFSITISPDGKYALSGSTDGSLKLWDMATGTEIRNFEEQTERIESVFISPDGRQALSGSRDGTLKLWDIDTGINTRTIIMNSEYSVELVSISPDWKYALSRSKSERYALKLWDIATGRVIRTLEGHNASVISFTISSGGKYALSGSWDFSSILWDLATGQVIKTFRGDTGMVSSVVISPDGKNILSGTWDWKFARSIRDNTLTFWNIANGQLIRHFEGKNNAVSVVAISSDGEYALSGTYFDFTLELWNIATGQEIRTFEYHTTYSLGLINSVSFTPSGKYAISGSDDTTLKLWDIATGQTIRTFEGHTGDVNSVAISSDEKYVLSAGGYLDNSLKLWDISTSQNIRTFSGHNGGVNSAFFTPDGKHILSGSDDTTLKLWDITTGQTIRTFEGHTDRVNSIAISPDGKHALSGSHDKTLRLWDISTGQEIRIFENRHISLISSVTFSPDGKFAISASWDGTVRIWNIATGKEIASFISFTDGEWIVITPDGYYNASPKGDEHLNVRIGNEVFGIDQFAAAFYQPEVVEARLQGKKDDPPIVKSRGDIRQATAPPGVDISVVNQDALTDTAELTITIYDQFKPIGKTDIEITVNGRLIGESELQAAISAKGIKPENTRLLASSQEQKFEFTIPVKLESGSNFIEVIAANDYSYGFKRIILNTPKTEIQPKGDLRILAIGVNNFTKNKPKSGFASLNYPASDIEKIIDSFKEQEGPGKRYNKVHTLIISDYEPIKPTKRSILANLGFLKKAGPNDTVLLFLSGHGKTENGVYYFLPSDTVFTGNGKFKPRSVINVEALVKALDIPGRKIVMLDTCDSGGAGIKNRLVRTLKNRSTVVFTASQDEENAWENMEYGGYFAHSIAEGISGKAASENMVQIIPLGEYITERVAALNKETGTPPQNPVKYIPDGYQNFVISMVE